MEKCSSNYITLYLTLYHRRVKYVNIDINK